MTGSVMLKNWKWVEKVLPGLLESQNWFPGFFWARELVPRPLPVQELVPRPLSSPGTGSKASFKPLVWNKTTYVKVWAPHTKDGGPLGIRDISMMSFGVDELCKRVSQKHKHAAHLTVSTWKSWWSKLNLSLYCLDIHVYLFVIAVFYLVQVIEMKNFIFYSRILSLIFFCIELSLH